MRDNNLIHLLLLKLRELSFEGRTISIPPNDTAIKLAGYSADEIESCFAQLLEEGLLHAGSQVDDDGNLVFTGLSTTGRDFVGAQPSAMNGVVPAQSRRSTCSDRDDGKGPGTTLTRASHVRVGAIGAVNILGRTQPG